MKGGYISPLALVNSPSCRIYYDNYVLGEYFPITSSICLFEINGHSPIEHEIQHAFGISNSLAQELFLKGWFGKFTHSDKKVLRGIESVMQFLEGHAAAIITLDCEANRGEAGFIAQFREVVGRPGLTLSPYGNKIKDDLVWVSEQVAPRDARGVCEIISACLLSCIERSGTATWDKALLCLKQNWQKFKGLDSKDEKLHLNMLEFLELEGFRPNNIADFFDPHRSLIRVLVAYYESIYMCAKVGNIVPLFPILPTLLNLAITRFGPRPLCLVSIDGNKSDEAIAIPCTIYIGRDLSAWLELYKVVGKSYGGCGLCSAFEDFATRVGECSEGELIKTELKKKPSLVLCLAYFWELLVEANNVLRSNNKCRGCRPLAVRLNGLKIPTLEETESIFRQAVEAYESWFPHYAEETAQYFLIRSGTSIKLRPTAKGFYRQQ